MPALARRIAERDSGFVLFALTPPRQSTPADRLSEIAGATRDRLSRLALDGLVLYDIEDEGERNPTERPFPFSPTIDPSEYRSAHLADWPTPVVVYRAVGKYTRAELTAWAAAQDAERTVTVMVGAATSAVTPAVRLSEAQAICVVANPRLLLGGVAIPERHSRRHDEHLRLIDKQAAGCSFFVTQIVFDLNAAKNLVSDYRYECLSRVVDPVPIVFTVSVCGSMRTLEFLRWLGVEVPRWIENDLEHASDPLAESSEQAFATALELAAFCRRLDVPFGINVESVSIRRAEIEAAVDLADRLIRGLRQ